MRLSGGKNKPVIITNSIATNLYCYHSVIILCDWNKQKSVINGYAKIW